MQQSINPADGSLLEEFPLHDDAATDAALSAAITAQRAWRRVPVEQRCTLLTAMAGALRAKRMSTPG